MIAGVLTNLIGNVDTVQDVIDTMRAIEVACPSTTASGGSTCCIDG